MKRFAFNSIRSRLLFWFFILSFVPFITTVIITYINQSQASKIRTIEKITAIRDLKVDKINNWVDESIGDMVVMSGDYELRMLENVFNDKSKSSEDFKLIKVAEELLHRNFRNYHRFSELFIINAKSGIIEISTDKSSIGRNKSQEPYFTNTLEIEEIYFSDIYLSETTNKPELTYSTPIFCLAHSIHIIGVLVGHIDLDYSIFPIMLERIGLGETGETLIVNKNVVALNKLRWHENAPLNLKIDAEPAIKAAQGYTGIIISKDYRGEVVLAAYTYLPKTRWGFITKQDMKELNAPVQQMIKDFVYLLLGFILIIIIVAGVVSNTISKPIVRLNNHTNKIRTDSYSLISNITSRDEIGSLAASINEMTESIQQKRIIQKGVADISSSIIKQSTLQEFSSDLLEKISSISGANMGAFYVLNELTMEFDPFSANGIEENLLKSISAYEPTASFGKKLLKKNIFRIPYPFEDTIFNSITANEYSESVEMTTVPILIEDIIVAFVIVVKNESFSKETNIILEQSLNNLNTSYSSLISNMRVSALADNVLKINDQLDIKTVELKEKNITLENQKNKVEDVNKELDAFAYSVSHDLRAPLRAIHGFTNILLDDFVKDMDDEGKRVGAIIKKNAIKMGELIDELLSFSRLGRTNMNRTLIDMKSLTNSIFEESTNEAEKKRIKFKVNDLPKIEGDLAMIRQVWVNLISNAVKYSSRKEKATIKIDYTKEKDGFTYLIKDNGAGFDMKYVDKLFGVFQRLHSENEFSGNGVGLALIQRIIHRHGGIVWAEGKVDKGASFYFTIPNSN